MAATVRLVLCLIGMGLLPAALGCDSLRFAPSETQKQNVYLHHRTVESAAVQARLDESSPLTQDLTVRAAQQSSAIVAYYGMPQELPATGSADELLSAANQSVSEEAYSDALRRPDPWDLADGLLEIGIAVSGLIGGVYGVRALSALRLARQKSTALREIITGNELFKRQNSQYAESFKQAQQNQSETTRSLVVSMK